MNLSTEDFINYFYSNQRKQSSVTIPICISPWTSSSQSLGVKVSKYHKKKLNKKNSLNDIPQSKLIMNSFYNTQNKNSTYYKIANYQNMSILTKVQYNQNVWLTPAFFSYNFVEIAISNFFLFVALENNTINIIDKDLGVLVYPQIKVTDRVHKLVTEQDYLICITFDNILRVWKISPEQCKTQSMMNVKIDIPVIGSINKIELTNELKDDSISPLIFCDDFMIRFSQSKNGWILISTSSHNPIMSQNSTAEFNINSNKMHLSTLYDVKKAFFNSLIYHESDNFIKYLTILLQKYSKYKNMGSIISLIEENLDLIESGVKEYCGINPKDLFNQMIEIVSEYDASFKSKISQLPKYLNVFNLKFMKRANEIINNPKNNIIIDDDTFIWPINQKNIDIYVNKENINEATAKKENDIICYDSQLNNQLIDSEKQLDITCNKNFNDDSDSNKNEKKKLLANNKYLISTINLTKISNSQKSHKRKISNTGSSKVKLNLLTEIGKISKVSLNKNSIIMQSNKERISISQSVSKFDISDSDLTSNNSD